MCHYLHFIYLLIDYSVLDPVYFPPVLSIYVSRMSIRRFLGEKGDKSQGLQRTPTKQCCLDTTGPLHT